MAMSLALGAAEVGLGREGHKLVHCTAWESGGVLSSDCSTP